MKHFCINLECYTNFYFEEHDIAVYHFEHQNDVFQVDNAIQIISDNINKIKLLIDNLTHKLNTLEFSLIQLKNKKEFNKNEKTAFHYCVLHPFQLDNSNDKISFHKTLISQTQTINSISQSSFKSFQPQFQQLLGNFNIWQLNCLNHYLEPLHSLVLLPKYNKTRLLCKEDDVQKGKTLDFCQTLLYNYNQQEICFAEMIKLREKIKHLRIQFDEFTRNIQEQLNSRIEINYPTFKNNEKFFLQHIQLKPQERMLNHEKMEKIAEFLSKISKNGNLEQIINNQQIEEIQIYISIFEVIENCMKNQLKVSSFTNYNLIMISLEIIQNSNVQGFQLQILANTTLSEIFDWALFNRLVPSNLKLTQINLHINYVSYNIKQLNCDQNYKQKLQSQFSQLQFKNNDLIQFEL